MARDVERMLFGVLAGFAGTLTLLALRTSSSRWLPETVPPMAEDPGHFMTRKLLEHLPESGQRRIPAFVSKAMSQSFALGYGLTVGVVYAGVRSRPANVLKDGLAVGVGTWAAGYLGWLPALGLIPPVWNQSRAQILGPLMRHAVFGLVVTAGYRTATAQSTRRLRRGDV